MDGSRHARLGHYVQPEKKNPTTMEEPRFLEQTAFIEKPQDLKAKSSPLVFYSPHVVPAEIPLVGALTSHITFRKPSFFCKGFIRLEVH